MKIVLYFSFLLTQTVYAQSVFQLHEVTQPAEPKGGFGQLERFVTNNLQVPFQARLQNIKGRIFVSGVIETNGLPSDLKILKGLHLLCDAEALRAMTLFKSWQPALKDGQPVRQVFNYSVLIPNNPVLDYDSTKRCLVKYYAQNYQTTENPAEYQYRQITPVDENGIANGNASLEQLKRNKWLVISSASFTRKDINYKINENDSIAAYSIMVRDETWNYYGPAMIFQKNGQLLSQTNYYGREMVGYTHYYPNGIVKETLQTVEKDVQRKMKWYDNGQMREIEEIDKNAAENLVLSLWDRNGNVLVKDGNGRAIYTQDSHKGKTIIEEGNFKDGYKDGKWAAKLADSTFF